MNVTPAERRIVALQAAIARCKSMMRTAKTRGDMPDYTRHMKQLYAFKQQLRNAQRVVEEHTQHPKENEYGKTNQPRKKHLDAIKLIDEVSAACVANDEKAQADSASP